MSFASDLAIERAVSHQAISATKPLRKATRLLRNIRADRGKYRRSSVTFQMTCNPVIHLWVRWYHYPASSAQKRIQKTGFYTRPIELTTKRRRVKCKITRGCAICSSDKFKSEEKNSTSHSLISSDDKVPPVGLACTLVVTIRRIFKSHVTMQPPIVSFTKFSYP